MTRRERHGRRTKTPQWLVYSGVAALVLAAVALAVVPILRSRPAPEVVAGARQVVITMGGFEPAHIVEAAGRPITLTIINPDSSFHTDGGGWHQFGSDDLKVDVRIPPQSRKTITLGPLSPGRYAFYCDVCCGGRSSPSMQGVLEITG
jgi:cytochrome c oxidase subunit 2